MEVLREKRGYYHIGLEKQIKNFWNLSRFGFWRRGANHPLWVHVSDLQTPQSLPRPQKWEEVFGKEGRRELCS